MESQRYWPVVRKWLWLIVLGTVLFGIVGFLVGRREEPVYRATASILIQDTTTTSSPLPGYGYSEPAVVAHAKLLKKESVLLEVITELSLPYSQSELWEKIGAHTSLNSPLIEVTADDADALTAQQIANTTANAYIRQYRSTVQAAAQAFLSQVQSEIDRTSARIEELQAKQGSVGLAIEEANELKSLENDLISLQTQRTLWNTELAQDVAAAGGVSVGESASLPVSPMPSRMPLTVGVFCILGLAVSTGGVFVKEYLDRSVKSAQDVSLLTGLSTLGAIPRFKADSESRNGLVSETHPRGSVAEAFRMLRTNLEFATLDRPARTLVITAPGPAEGKTSILANLAVTLAQTGKKVIAADGDLRHSSVHEKFDVANDMGLANLLVAQQPDVDGYLHASKIPGLEVLPAGSSTPNAADLLSSSRVAFLIEQLEKQADIILFDSPPILAVADAAILAPKVDGVVLVVNAGHTKPEALVEAAKILSKGNARVLGVVLNRVKKEGGGSYYYHRGSDYYDEGDGKKRRATHAMVRQQDSSRLP